MATLISDTAPGEHTAHVTIPAKADDVGFGRLLKSAREGRGLTLQQIASETKISPKHLEALERSDVPDASERFYRRADIRTYARAVHCDERLVIAVFERAVQTSVSDAPAPAPLPQRAPLLSRRRLAVGAAVILVAAVLGRVAGDPRSFVRNAPASADAVPAPLAVAVPPATSPDAVPAARVAPIEQAQPSTPVERSVVPQRAVAPPADTPVAAAPVASEVAPGVVPAGGMAVAPAAAGGFTELVVTTNPAGARVTVNGVGWGVAPVTIRYLPPGAKRVRITKDGFAPEEQVVQLVEGAAKSLDVRLTAR
jgi:cytoskeletal protein RodZ